MSVRATVFRRALRYVAYFAPHNSVRIEILKRSGTIIGENVYIGRLVQIGCGVSIGDSCHLVKGCSLEGDVQLGSRVYVNAYARINHARLDDDVVVGEFARVFYAVIGKRSHIENSVLFTGFQEGKITIGDDTYIGLMTILDWSGGLEIGNCVHIAGPTTGVWTHTSYVNALLGYDLNYDNHRTAETVTIGNNNWIGGNCTIYPGVTVGHNSMILPNSAVNKDVQPYSLVGGVPIQLLRKIVIEDDILSFQALKNQDGS